MMDEAFSEFVTPLYVILTALKRSKAEKTLHVSPSLLQKDESEQYFGGTGT